MTCLLLVDDNADFRVVFQRKFVELGYRVLAAPDGVRGLQAVLDEPVDLIVLDLRMPYRDGLETLRLIRSVRPAVPVVILSALVEPGTEAQVRELGVAEVLLKPISIRDLAGVIQRALGADGV